MSNNAKYPELIFFAGPNGSGKTTITKLAKVIEPYINADEIKKTNHCTDIEAAELAVKLREDALREKQKMDKLNRQETRKSLLPVKLCAI